MIPRRFVFSVILFRPSFAAAYAELPPISSIPSGHGGAGRFTAVAVDPPNPGIDGAGTGRRVTPGDLFTPEELP
jgi:hypothetical protein